MNRGGGYGLEIPVLEKFEGHSRSITWAMEKIQTLHKVYNNRLKRCEGTLQ